MKVGIHFGDNDFHNPLSVFMKLFIIPTFVEREKGHFVTHLTSSMIVELFNTHIIHVYKYEILNSGIGLYRIQPENLTYLKEYLKITEQNVYWDGQIDNHIGMWQGNCNGEFKWTDGIEVYSS